MKVFVILKESFAKSKNSKIKLFQNYFVIALNVFVESKLKCLKMFCFKCRAVALSSVEEQLLIQLTFYASHPRQKKHRVY